MIWTSSQDLLTLCFSLKKHVHWRVDTIAKTDPGFPKMTRYIKHLSAMLFNYFYMHICYGHTDDILEFFFIVIL